MRYMDTAKMLANIVPRTLGSPKSFKFLTIHNTFMRVKFTTTLYECVRSSTLHVN